MVGANRDLVFICLIVDEELSSKCLNLILALENDIKNRNMNGICLPFTNTKKNNDSIKKIKNNNLMVNIYLESIDLINQVANVIDYVDLLTF